MGEPPMPCPSLQRLPFVFGLSLQWTFNPLRLPFSRVALNLWEQRKELAAITSIGRKARRGWLSCSDSVRSSKAWWALGHRAGGGGRCVQTESGCGRRVPGLHELGQPGVAEYAVKAFVRKLL